MAKITAIANQKGGVGKTTTAVNLATCVAQQGKRALLIDIDPQGNATSGVGIDKENCEYSVYDMLINGISAERILVETQVEGLYALPARIELAGAEIELVSQMSREFKLKNALKGIGDRFDYIFIDCPPSLGLLTLNALAAADTLLVPIQCEYYALEGLSQLMNTVRLVRLNLNPELVVEGVVMTMYDARTRLSNQVVAEVKKFFQNKVYNTVIPRSVRLGEAPSFGLPISIYDPKCGATRAYTSLAEELLDADEAANMGGEDTE